MDFVAARTFAFPRPWSQLGMVLTWILRCDKQAMLVLSDVLNDIHSTQANHALQIQWAAVSAATLFYAVLLGLLTSLFAIL